MNMDFVLLLQGRFLSRYKQWRNVRIKFHVLLTIVLNLGCCYSLYEGHENLVKLVQGKKWCFAELYMKERHGNRRWPVNNGCQVMP